MQAHVLGTGTFAATKGTGLRWSSKVELRAAGRPEVRSDSSRVVVVQAHAGLGWDTRNAAACVDAKDVVHRGRLQQVAAPMQSRVGQCRLAPSPPKRTQVRTSRLLRGTSSVAARRAGGSKQPCSPHPRTRRAPPLGRVRCGSDRPVQTRPGPNCAILFPRIIRRATGHKGGLSAGPAWTQPGAKAPHAGASPSSGPPARRRGGSDARARAGPCSKAHGFVLLRASTVSVMPQ